MGIMETRRLNIETVAELKKLFKKIKLRLTDDDEGVDTREVIISTDSYIPMGQGMFTRALKDRNDFIGEIEEGAGKYLDECDFCLQHIMLTLCERGSYMPPHIHETEEKLIVVKGLIRESINGSTLKPGDSLVIAGNQVHSLVAEEESIIFSCLRMEAEEKLRVTTPDEELCITIEI